jgi:polysaccharide pyruvyl transferase WcaK-like protein
MTRRLTFTAPPTTVPAGVSRRDCLKALLLAGSVPLAASLAGAEPAAQPPVPVAGAKRILLYSGWAVHNIGDVGHTPGTLRYLGQHLPEAQVTCWLRKSNAAVLAMLKTRFPAVTFVTDSNLDNMGKASTPELQTAFDGADLFMQNSGMHFTRYWQPPVGLLQACIRHKKPFGLYGQSFDGFRPLDAEALPGLLSQAAFIFCRDTESLKFLRGAGVAPKILEFGPDGCFGIDVRDDAKAAAFMQANGLEPKKFITVTLRTDKEVSVIQSEETGGPTALTPDEWAGRLRELITAWVTRTGLKVAIVPEVEKEIAPGKRLLFDLLPENIRTHVVHLDRWWTADEATALYAQAHTVVAVEPHSCIMALAMGTPAIHWFTWKHGYKAWMFRDIGLSEWLIDIDHEPTSNAIAALERITVRYDLAQQKVKRAMAFVNARSAEMMSDVRRAMG